jgi:hypothetical protein
VVQQKLASEVDNGQGHERMRECELRNRDTTCASTSTVCSGAQPLPLCITIVSLIRAVATTNHHSQHSTHVQPPSPPQPQSLPPQ